MNHNAIHRTSTPARLGRTRKLCRNNVEALEPRVLLSGHGVNVHDSGGVLEFAVMHATAPVRVNAAPHIQDEDHSDSDGNRIDVAPILSWDPIEIVDSSFAQDGWSAGGSSRSGRGFAVAQIVFADPLPGLTAGGSNIQPNVEHPSNSAAGYGDTPQSDWGLSDGGGQPAGSQNSVHPKGGASSQGADGASRETSGSQDQAGQSQGDGDFTLDLAAQEFGIHFMLLHANGNLDVTSGQTAPAAQPNIARPINAPAPGPIPIVSTSVQSVKSATAGDSDPAAPAVVTPLAFAPVRQTTALSLPVSAHQDLVVAAVPGDHDTAAPALAGVASQAAAPVCHWFGQAGVIVPSILIDARAIEAVPASIHTAAGELRAVGAVVADAEAMASNAVAGSLPAKMAYNFVQFDAAVFHDAVSVFAAELATLARPAAFKHSTARAWIITGAVLGFDAIFLTYWHQKVRREKQARIATAPVVPDPRVPRPRA